MSFLVGLYLFVFPTTTFQAPCRMESLLHDQPEPPSKGSAITSLSSACRIEMKFSRNISTNVREFLLGSRHCMFGGGRGWPWACCLLENVSCIIKHPAIPISYIKCNGEFGLYYFYNHESLRMNYLVLVI